VPRKKDLTVAGMFSDVPKVIRKKGRVAGFTHLRDRILDKWEILAAKANAYSLLKLAIEADRHAMFAQVAETKAKDSYDTELYRGLSDYLAGKVDAAPDATGKYAEIRNTGPLNIHPSDEALEELSAPEEEHSQHGEQVPSEPVGA